MNNLIKLCYYFDRMFTIPVSVMPEDVNYTYRWRILFFFPAECHSEPILDVRCLNSWFFLGH